MNECLFIGGTNDGRRIDARGERFVYLPTVPNGGFVFKGNPEKQTSKTERFRTLELHVEGRLFSIYVHEDMSNGDAMQKLIDCYRK